MTKGPAAQVTPATTVTPTAPPEPAADLDERSAESGAEFERFRLQYGREIVVMGFLVLTAVVAIVVVAFEASTGAAAVLGAVTTLIGTLVGTFFGAQIGSQGRERDAASRELAQDRALRAVALLDPQTAREYGPMLFGTSAGEDPFARAASREPRRTGEDVEGAP